MDAESWCDRERAGLKEDDDDLRHCFHDCEHNGEAASVCCHCGDVFLADDEPNGIEHGRYRPALAKSWRKRERAERYQRWKAKQ